MGGKQARETLAQLEQFRGALGQAVGKTELKTVWPVTVVVDIRGGSVHLTGPPEWQARIGKLAVVAGG